MATTYAIPDGRLAMAATLYTGNASTKNISNAVNGVSFQPDLVWVKSRSNAYYGTLVDSVRGVDKYLYSALTIAEETQTTALSSFNSNGFSLNGSFGNVNANAATYVGWLWKAGGTAVSNTAGSITSSVSANTTAGFSVVTYTGTGANATVGHGLGVAPSMVIVKNRTSGTTDVWCVYHSSLGATQLIILNRTDATATVSTAWNSTAPTSSVFSLGTLADANRSTNTYVAYCFAPVAGYSAMGSYVGNGSSDGSFIYLGFRPRFIMIKASSSVADWDIFDSSRDTYNTGQYFLFPNVSTAEQTLPRFDLLSNGIKLRTTGDPNNSGVTYIYMAFAENPFKYANAR